MNQSTEGELGRRTQEVVEQIRADLESRAESPLAAHRAGVERALAESRRLSTVTAHWGIAPSWPVFGSIEVLVKRVMRILLRWYINPIVEQQNDYNMSVLATLYEIEAQLAALASDIAPDDSDKNQDTSR